MDDGQKSKISWIINCIAVVEDLEQVNPAKFRASLVDGEIHAIINWFLDRKLFVKAQPLDHWDIWVPAIWAEDLMSPFYDILALDEVKEFTNYTDALIEAMNLAIDSVMCANNCMLLKKYTNTKFLTDDVMDMKKTMEKYHLPFVYFSIDNEGQSSFFIQRPTKRAHFKLTVEQVDEIISGKLIENG